MKLARGLAFAAEFMIARAEWGAHWSASGGHSGLDSMCGCGRGFSTNVGRGLHAAAARKRADRRMNQLIDASVDGRDCPAGGF